MSQPQVDDHEVCRLRVRALRAERLLARYRHAAAVAIGLSEPASDPVQIALLPELRRELDWRARS